MTESALPPSPPPAIVLDSVDAARARGILKGREEAILARLEGFAADLFPGDAGFFRTLFRERRSERERSAVGARELGERFWLATLAGTENLRVRGGFYTPTPVIDRILDMACADLLRKGSALRPDVTVCDPAMGCGFFLLRLVERLLARNRRRAARLADWAGECLFGVDGDPAAVFVARVSLWLALSGPQGEFIPSPGHFPAGDSLLGGAFAPGIPDGGLGLNWARAFPGVAAAGGFDRVVGNPPYEVLTNFARRPQHKALARRIRESGHYRDSLGGQINLYRCFIERALDLLKPGGSMSFVVPFSLARDASAQALRKRLIEECDAGKWLLFDEKDRLFPGVSQSACIFSATRDGGPAKRLTIVSDGKTRSVPLASVRKFTGDALTVRAFGRDEEKLLERIWRNCPGVLADAADMRVGEVDQTFFRDCMTEEDTGVPLARGEHVSAFTLNFAGDKAGKRFLRLERFLEEKGGAAGACRRRASVWRVAQLGIRNMRTVPRLVAALVPPGVYLGNSLNAYTPRAGLSIEYLAGTLNSRLLDWLFRLASGNNNINLHEMRRLPFPLDPSRKDWEAVAEAYRSCAMALKEGKNPQEPLARLNAAVEKCYGVGTSFAALALRKI